MPSAPNPIEHLLATLDPAALTLLPTADSARSLRRAFDDAQRARGLRAWQPANILSWSQLLDRLWSDAIVTGIEPRLLLNATQEHALWRDILTTAADTLASPDSLATLCAEAWSLANAYNATARLLATATTHDSRTFAGWAETFTRDCNRNQYLTRAALEAALAEHLTTQALTAPATLTLLGFDNLTPAQQTLLEALRTTGTTITELPFPSASAEVENENAVLSTEAHHPQSVLSTEALPLQSVLSTEAHPPQSVISTEAHPLQSVISTEAHHPQSVISTEAHHPQSVISTEAHPLQSVISTEAKRSGETPVFSPRATTANLLEASATTTANPLEGARLQPCQNPSPQQGALAPEVSLAKTKDTASIYSATSPQDELRAIAHYLRTYLESSEQPEAPPRIAVLLPDATEDLATTFREILAPELQSITADISSTPWQLPNAGPLATQPILATALDLAHLAHSPLDIPRASALVLSPYLEPEAGARDLAARFDAESLRKRATLRPEITLTALHRLAQSTAHAPAWIKPFHHFLTATNLDTPRTYAAWAELLRALLHTANWPSLTRPLTSLEYQATEAWDALLDQLSTLDFRGKRTSYADFLSILTRQATTTQFIPASTNAPIQILTPATAIAQHFDVLIFARATDANYPAAERTHPLLGFALQSQHNMPGANPLEAAARARQTFAQLLTAAPNILLTYAAQTPEGEQHLSPLLAALTHPEPVNIAFPDTTAITPTILIPDDTPLPTHEGSGGTNLLKLQAACPFQAFAKLRLRSDQLGTQTTGYDAIESGNFLHRALSIFWTHMQTQKKLRDTPLDERTALIAAAVDQAVNPKFLLESAWDASYIDVQKERLRRVLKDWLEQELLRSPFTVLASEKDVPLTLGPLTLNLRIDRIDAVEGGHVYVDYKTGASAKPNLWEGPRPDEPQLPLYALLSDPDELKALTFARVRTGDDMSWQGYQADTGILPQKKPATIDFHYQTEEWRTTLTALAEDFAAGVATVDPKDYPKTCEHCVQRLLCRIHPESIFTQPDEPEDTGEESE